MDPVLIKVIATAAWVVITAVFGILLGRRGRPYGVWKPIVHSLLFLPIAAGSTFALLEVLNTAPLRLASLVALSVVALGVASNLAVGITMLFIKTAKRRLVVHHTLGAIVIAGGLAAAATFSIFKV